MSEQREIRMKTIIRTSVIGIASNVLLAAFKAAVGLAANSIAVLLDAVNNFSDAASSVITMIGARLAGKQPDRKHPFGHGRVEYLSAMIIAVIIMYAGITSLIESVKKIIRPEQADYSAVTLIVISVAIVVKILLGLYVRSTGRRVRSQSLENSGADALFDSVISLSTLIAAAIYLIFDISLEAWLGVIISLFIIKSAVEMLHETISQLLGKRPDPELAKAIKDTVCSFPEVLGVYDLVLHDYGPDLYQGSVHIEVPDTLPIDELDELNRSIAYKVYEEQGVALTAVGVYSLNTKSETVKAAKEQVEKIVFTHDHVLQMHGFYLNESKKTLRFDLVIGFSAGDRSALYDHIVKEVSALFPDYSLQVVMDTDFSES